MGSRIAMHLPGIGVAIIHAAVSCMAITGVGVGLVHADEASSWTQFRGDAGDGLALGTNLPTRWSESENVLWKTPIHGRGWSSPVVSEDEIWLTTASEDGQRMSVLCLDASDGRIKQDLLVFENDAVQPDYHVTNSYASPTPVLDEQHVYVHFGAYGTACLNRKTGELLWQRRDLPCNHYRGPGSSPILYQDLLIFHMDGFDYQYAIALNKKNGETVWKKDRDVEYGTDNGDFYKAFSTPLVISVGGRDQLISPASMCCVALDPSSGQELWRVRYEEHSTTVRPLFDGKRIFLSTGFGKAKMLCVRVGGTGDVTETHVEWVQRQGIGSKPSPVLVHGNLYCVTDDGVLVRIDPDTGDIGWKERLGGKFSASLIANDANLYAFDHDGKSYVYTLTDPPVRIAENQLAEGCNASPAVLGNSILVRTTSALYRLQNSP